MALELSELIPNAALGSVMFQAPVIQVEGRKLTVDLGGPVIVEAVDSCNPQVGQQALILQQGTTYRAVGAFGGPYRQATITVVSSTTDTVTGVVNGVSRSVQKAWAFTPSNGDVLPLLWSPDGATVVALGSADTVSPGGGSGGGGGGGGGGGTSTYKTTYAPSGSGWRSELGGSSVSTRSPVDLNFGVGGAKTGYYRYGTNRFNELQGRTIVSARIKLERQSGSGNVTIRVFKGSLNPSSTSISPSGWVSLPLTRLNELRAGTGQTEIRVSGSGILRAAPSGVIEVTWRK